MTEKSFDEYFREVGSKYKMKEHKIIEIDNPLPSLNEVLLSFNEVDQDKIIRTIMSGYEKDGTK